MVVDDEAHRRSSAAATLPGSSQSHEPRASRWAQATQPGGGDAVAVPAVAPRPGSRWAAQAAAVSPPQQQPLPQPQQPEERHVPDDGELESSHGGWHLIEGQAAPALPAPLPAAVADAPQLVAPTPAPALRPMPPSRFRDADSSAGHQWPESHQQQQQHEYAQDHDMQRRRAPSDDGQSRSPPGNASRMRQQPPPQQQYQQQQWGRPDSYADGAWSRHWAEGGAPAAGGDDRSYVHDSRRSEHRYYDDAAPPDYGGPDLHEMRSRGYPRDPRDTGYADAGAAWPPHQHHEQHQQQQPLPFGHHHGHYEQQQQLHHYHQYPEQLHHHHHQQHSLESGHESHWDQPYAGQHHGHGSGSSGGGNYPEDERRWDKFAQSHPPQHHQQLLPLPEQPPHAAAAPVDVEAEAVAELDALKDRALRAPLHEVLSKPNELRIFELELALVQRTAALREARERLAVSAAVADVYVQAADRLLGLASDTSGAI